MSTINPALPSPPTAPHLLARRRLTKPQTSAALFLSELSSAMRKGGRQILGVLGRAVQGIGLRRRRHGVIDRYLRAHAVRKLQLGSGPVSLDGWLNADLRPRRPGHIFINVLERLPFESSTLDYVLAEHLIGDLTYGQCIQMLAECHRVLSPGGRIRLSTPDLERLASLYSSHRTPTQEHYLRWAIDEYALSADAYLEGFAINNLFQEYRFIYDAGTLGQALRVAGFDDVRRVDAGESGDPELAGLDSHGKVLGDSAVNAFESLIVEAVKPGHDKQ